MVQKYCSLGRVSCQLHSPCLINQIVESCTGKSRRNCVIIGQSLKNLVMAEAIKKRRFLAMKVTLPHECTDIFSLSDDQSVKFWGGANSIDNAQSAIEQRINSVMGISNCIHILPMVGNYVIKVYSSAINNSAKRDDSCLRKIFLELKSSLPPSDEILIKKYLACCIPCCNNFSGPLRILLIQTLAARSLLPSTSVVLTSKGGILLMIDWLKELFTLSNDVSEHLVGLLLLFIDRKSTISRQSSDSAIHSLLEFSSANKLSSPNMLWKELWNNIGINPSVVGKKQALALLQYSITTYQSNSFGGDLHETASSPIECNQRKRVSDTSLRLRDLCRNIHCPELLPFVIICHSGQDLNSASAALHLLATNAHSSITVGTTNFNSQKPTAIWTAVLKACVECLKLVCSSAISNKANQHKILAILNQVLNGNPFERKFKLKCTAKQSIAIILTELKVLKCVRRASDSQDSANVTEVKAETDDAIEFLTQELLFVKTIQSSCFPSVLDMLSKGRQSKISTRTMALIANILQCRCCGLDPVLIMSSMENLPQDINDLVIDVIRSRCFHQDAFLEIASEVMDKSEFAEHFLKSQEYFQLLKLSSLCQSSTATIDKLYEDACEIGRSLLSKLEGFVRSQKPFIIDNGNNDDVLYTRKLQVILLALSVLPIKSNTRGKICDAYRVIANFLLRHLLTIIEELRIRILSGSKYAALHCTFWLLFLSRTCQNFNIPGLLDEHNPAFLTNEATEILASTIYPDLLINSYVMPAAVAFAMHLRDPQRLLFESIGHLQDATFNLKETMVVDFVHYAHLIATTVTESSITVRETARARVVAVDDKYLHESKSSGLPPTDEMRDDSRYGIESSLSLYSAKEEYDQGVNENDVDYMSTANLQERVDEAVINDLEDIISSDKSFLACFLPMFTEILISEDLAESIRMGALRTLNAYMKCSKTVLVNHIDLLEVMITRPLRILNDVLCKYHYDLQIEAMLVWIETFNVTVMELVTPVRAIINCLESFMTSDTLRGDDISNTVDGNLANDNASEKILDFSVAILKGMQCLITDNKIRDPAEYAVAISIPFAFKATGSGSTCKAIQEESRSILRGLFLQYPKIFTRTIYQLCLTAQPSASDNSAKATAPVSQISDLLQSKIGEKDRLRIVGVIIKIAKSEEDLTCKLNEIDRALTEESIRCNNIFAAAALLHLPVTNESRKAIIDAAALGVLDSLDPLISKQLNARISPS